MFDMSLFFGLVKSRVFPRKCHRGLEMDIEADILKELEAQYKKKENLLSESHKG